MRRAWRQGRGAGGCGGHGAAPRATGQRALLLLVRCGRGCGVQTRAGSRAWRPAGASHVVRLSDLKPSKRVQRAQKRRRLGLDGGGGGRGGGGGGGGDEEVIDV